ncbi:MAG: hypothetical protein C0601_13565 [Candidatus Muiribacterium halophilum]|uniref:Uncharacterized protein n=1 Tax=Muiribacterium halophilum TaxID=2053465 RepID=A0A2N5Z9C9_MUIH1|nr:MAG: hypothetical protein C0601_13565 [Candidatus Muirbacterium halophilum]
MKIADFSIDLYSDNFSITHKEISEIRENSTKKEPVKLRLPEDQVSIGCKDLCESQSFEYSISEEDRQKILLIEKMISAISGKEYKINIAENVKGKKGGLKKNQTLKKNTIDVSKIKANTSDKEEGKLLERHELYLEHSRTDFTATGKINISDGRSIDIDINLHMSYDIKIEKHEYFNQGKQVDPLIINYDGELNQLSKEKYSFDLVVGGEKESLRRTGKGSGYLALDKDNSGIIENGQELFGAKSGDGFSELSKYDEDKNGWIDENDSVFDKLKILQITEDGSQNIFSIKEKGVGAIFLTSQETNFSIKDENAEKLAQIRKTGIFLKEDGKAGSIQHVDLVI